jgi:hypothetical protein
MPNDVKIKQNNIFLLKYAGIFIDSLFKCYYIFKHLDINDIGFLYVAAKIKSGKGNNYIF